MKAIPKKSPCKTKWRVWLIDTNCYMGSSLDKIIKEVREFETFRETEIYIENQKKLELGY